MRNEWAARSVADPVKPDVAAPTFCPFCRSKELTTASKVINESTYWRCVPCGEIWNPGRLRPSAPPGISRRW
jgi:ribosomal protein L37AE/L43A